MHSLTMRDNSINDTKRQRLKLATCHILNNGELRPYGDTNANCITRYKSFKVKRHKSLLRLLNTTVPSFHSHGKVWKF